MDLVPVEEWSKEWGALRPVPDVGPSYASNWGVGCAEAGGAILINVLAVEDLVERVWPAGMNLVGMRVCRALRFSLRIPLRALFASARVPSMPAAASWLRSLPGPVALAPTERLRRRGVQCDFAQLVLRVAEGGTWGGLVDLRWGRCAPWAEGRCGRIVEALRRGCFPSLTRLDLGGNGLDQAFCASLREAVRNGGLGCPLEELALDGNRLRAGGVRALMSGVLQGIPSLWSLSIRANLLEARGAKELALGLERGAGARLGRLDAGHNAMGCAGVALVCGAIAAHATSITWLGLEGEGLQGPAGERLAALAPGLSRLELAHSPVTGARAAALALERAGGGVGLEGLSLNAVMVDAAPLPWRGALGGCRLESLSLKDVRLVGALGGGGNAALARELAASLEHMGLLETLRLEVALGARC